MHCDRASLILYCGYSAGRQMYKYRQHAKPILPKPARSHYFPLRLPFVANDFVFPAPPPPLLDLLALLLLLLLPLLLLLLSFPRAAFLSLILLRFSSPAKLALPLPFEALLIAFLAFRTSLCSLRPFIRFLTFSSLSSPFNTARYFSLSVDVSISLLSNCRLKPFSRVASPSSFLSYFPSEAVLVLVNLSCRSKSASFAERGSFSRAS